jgi:hypothetical protein
MTNSGSVPFVLEANCVTWDSIRRQGSTAMAMQDCTEMKADG